MRVAGLARSALGMARGAVQGGRIDRIDRCLGRAVEDHMAHSWWESVNRPEGPVRTSRRLSWRGAWRTDSHRQLETSDRTRQPH